MRINCVALLLGLLITAVAPAAEPAASSPADSVGAVIVNQPRYSPVDVRLSVIVVAGLTFKPNAMTRACRLSNARFSATSITRSSCQTGGVRRKLMRNRAGVAGGRGDSISRPIGSTTA